ncbi:glutamate 5-kinase [Pikeienuella sp. HZG-20]|uniref:glutamate 5-kinase n=1 Tax=Paludibacillus litoralis TaxID=3133267 RepID=UPI0030EB81BD
MEALSAAPRLAAARRVVVKIGSALLVDAETGALRSAWLKGLAADAAALRARGAEVLLVSSGSIALGRRALALGPGPLALEQAQAAAAVGQIRLARAYEEALEPHDLKAGQVLMTLDDTRDRRRYLNGRATLKTLLGFGVIPIVNENDTVATDEIRYGDNDRLAAQIASMAGADALVLLSDVDGLYDADPRVDPAARLIPLVTELTPEIEAMAGGAGTAGAKGGMRTKLIAARAAMKAGCAMAITRGDRDRPLRALESGAAATWFAPTASPRAARKQWIAAMPPEGRLVIDAGAAAALRRGKSLLPAGVRAVEGDFGRGDPVLIADEAGAGLGVALAGYSAAEAQAIIGLHSARIAVTLGHPGRAAMAHRDDMVIWS